MSFLRIPFGRRDWQVRQPAVVRYLAKIHVDAFFEDGTLRLSSFRHFRSHPDEVCRDGREGLATASISSPNSKGLVTGVCGQEQYVLCASAIESKELADRFGKDAGLRIDDPLRFADLVAKRVDGFAGGASGPCAYTNDVGITASDPIPFVPPRDGEDGEEVMRRFSERQQSFAIGAYFVKHLRFHRDAEFRFIWFTSGPERDYPEIKVPDARRFCSPVVFGHGKALDTGA